MRSLGKTTSRSPSGKMQALFLSSGTWQILLFCLNPHACKLMPHLGDFGRQSLSPISLSTLHPSWSAHPRRCSLIHRCLNKTPDLPVLSPGRPEPCHRWMQGLVWSQGPECTSASLVAIYFALTIIFMFLFTLQWTHSFTHSFESRDLPNIHYVLRVKIHSITIITVASMYFIYCSL